MLAHNLFLGSICIRRQLTYSKKHYFLSITKHAFQHIFILTASNLGIIIRLSKLIIAKAYLATLRPNKWYTLFTRKFFQIRPQLAPVKAIYQAGSGSGKAW